MRSDFRDSADPRKKEWDRQFPDGPTLDEAQKILSRDLPFECHFLVSQESGGRMFINLEGIVGITTVLKVDDLLICKNPIMNFPSFIGLDEIRLDPLERYDELKGIGIGKVFTDNMVALSRALDIPRIRLTAGRENGPIFWGRHGFNIEKISSGSNFWKARKNYEDIRNRSVPISTDATNIIEQAFDEACMDQESSKHSAANRKLAGLLEKVQGVPLNELLFKDVEYKAILDLENSDQKAAFDHAMQNIDQIRDKLKSLYPLQPQGLEHAISRALSI